MNKKVTAILMILLIAGCLGYSFGCSGWKYCMNGNGDSYYEVWEGNSCSVYYMSDTLKVDNNTEVEVAPTVQKGYKENEVCLSEYVTT